MRLRHAVLCTLVAPAAAALTLALTARPAHACGGCFSPPETITTVDSHRMVIALSPDKSILWDQIRYTGDPEDFVWVLPVPSPDAVVAVADDLFFAELEAQTAPQVIPPPLPPLDCPPPPDDWGDGAGGAIGAQDAGAASPDAGVDVYREEVVGPYQTVVIGSEDPDALVAWLNEHGYSVPGETTPTIRHYTDLGSLFVVLRLAPDQGITAMQPVRVEYPGYMATFPLKMVTVGAYGSLQMTLWVIAEQRYRALNYAGGTIDPADLVWDFATGSSNYLEVFRQSNLALGSRAWITQYAQPLATLFFTTEEVAAAQALIPYPFITRLQADMLVDHLNADLQLGPDLDAGSLNRTLQAEQWVNDVRTCPDWDGDGQPDTWDDYRERTVADGLFGCGCNASPGAAGGAGLLLIAAVLLAFRPRRRR
ncbi:MAG TPA: DUF2330 domain-containing protein [Kofleriaceae bacterium]|nr:DUF2330 domain-containing protein [Kofleriaceae bacterium]